MISDGCTDRGPAVIQRLAPRLSWPITGTAISSSRATT